ncbi:MAG TPA: hypothetical protein VI282_09615, partial [Verrucomicrobiae bacterium]
MYKIKNLSEKSSCIPAPPHNLTNPAPFTHFDRQPSAISNISNPRLKTFGEAPPNSRTYDIALHSVLTQHMKYGKRYSAQFKRDAVELLISG